MQKFFYDSRKLIKKLVLKLKTKDHMYTDFSEAFSCKTYLKFETGKYHKIL